MGLAGFWVKVLSPRAGRGWGLERPDLLEGDVRLLAAAFRRSSVALRRASSSSSSEVWEDTFCFLDSC